MSLNYLHMKMFNKKAANLTILSASLFILTPLLAFAANWTPPMFAPPGGNVPAPVNAGDISQTRVGSLLISGTGNFLNAPLGYFGSVGIGTTNPVAKLDVAGGGNINIDNTTHASPYGIISKGGVPFLSDFNYGDNGTVTTDGYNTFVGLGAGNLTMGSGAYKTYYASFNTAEGYNALHSNTWGYNNTAQGYGALYSNGSGYSNTAQGYKALFSNLGGSMNTAQGDGALSSNTTGSLNSAQGKSALYSNTTGGDNTAQGYHALGANTTGSNNVAQGYAALDTNTTGSNNIAIGFAAGAYVPGSPALNQTGESSVFLGGQTKALANGQTNQIVIGYNATGIGSNSVVLGDNTITKTALKGNVGIGTVNPSQKLEINGGMRLNTATAKPACSSIVRGTFWFTQGATGVKDDVEVCAKDTSDAYAWRTIY